jgi:hypothetical protein
MNCELSDFPLYHYKLGESRLEFINGASFGSELCTTAGPCKYQSPGNFCNVLSSLDSNCRVNLSCCNILFLCRSREICMCSDRTSCQVCFLFQPPLLAFLCTFLSNQLTIELRFDSSGLVMLSLFVLRMNVRFNCCRYCDPKTGLPYATVEAFKVIQERYTFCFIFYFSKC